jgi:hypothetical protein
VLQVGFLDITLEMEVNMQEGIWGCKVVSTKTSADPRILKLGWP